MNFSLIGGPATKQQFSRQHLQKAQKSAVVAMQINFWSFGNPSVPGGR